jgi:hypothetical protein
VLFTEVTLLDTLCPSVDHAVTPTMTIRTSSSAYSTVLNPSSSCHSYFMAWNMEVPLSGLVGLDARTRHWYRRGAVALNTLPCNGG